MCYAIILSSTSSLNLTDLNDGLITFDRNMWGLNEEKYLKYPNKWMVMSEEGCGCGFRHVAEELGFGLPEDWYPEDKKGIKATEKLIKIIRDLVKSGEKVDCLNPWLDDETKSIEVIEENTVNLNEISDKEFRFNGFKQYVYI